MRKMKRIQRQKPFLQAIVPNADRNRRKELTKHANKDQIDAVSEIVLNSTSKQRAGDSCDDG